MKLFGRDPALWVSAIGALLGVLAATQNPWVDPGQAAAIVLLLSSVVAAALTRPVAPALFTGVVAAGVALLAEYQLDVSPSLTAAIGGAVLTVLALVGVRPQVAPVESPVSDA